MYDVLSANTKECKFCL